MTQEAYTLEQLSQLSNGEIDILIAKEQGYTVSLGGGHIKTWALFDPQGKAIASIGDEEDDIPNEATAWFWLRRDPHLPHPSTDLNAAGLLLDEMASEFYSSINCTPRLTNSVGLHQYPLAPNKGVIHLAEAEGKPSIALPRAISLAYYLFKTNQQ